MIDDGRLVDGNSVQANPQRARKVVVVSLRAIDPA
jgi:hypothetical protein